VACGHDDVGALADTNEKMSSKRCVVLSYILQFSLKKKQDKFIFNDIELFGVVLNISTLQSIKSAHR
jgi:hypothetical protein